MTELSPATQAVLNAFRADWKDEHLKQDVKCLAAALRAAADHVVPEEPLYYGDQRWQFERDTRQRCRQQLLAIADELEAQ